MGCFANETLEHKEEGQHTNESTTTTIKDVPFPKITGEEHQADKEEVDDHNTILPPLHHP